MGDSEDEGTPASDRNRFSSCHVECCSKTHSAEQHKKKQRSSKPKKPDVAVRADVSAGV